MKHAYADLTTARAAERVDSYWWLSLSYRVDEMVGRSPESKRYPQPGMRSAPVSTQYDARHTSTRCICHMPDRG